MDGGAYNGDTYRELCGIAEVEEAYLFEPDPANFVQLTRHVAETGRTAQCLPLGVADSYRALSFNAGTGEAASISTTGAAHIAVAALDDVLVGHTVDFIKLDVEGAELEILKSFDFDFFKPSVIAVEIHGNNLQECLKSDEARLILGKGYQFVGSAVITQFFARKDEILV